MTLPATQEPSVTSFGNRLLSPIPLEKYANERFVLKADDDIDSVFLTIGWRYTKPAMAGLCGRYNVQ